MENVQVCEPRDTAEAMSAGESYTRSEEMLADSPRTRRAEVIETTPGAVPGIAHLARQTRYGFS